MVAGIYLVHTLGWAVCLVLIKSSEQPRGTLSWHAIHTKTQRHRTPSLFAPLFLFWIPFPPLLSTCMHACKATEQGLGTIKTHWALGLRYLCDSVFHLSGSSSHNCSFLQQLWFQQALLLQSPRAQSKPWLAVSLQAGELWVSYFFKISTWSVGWRLC